jgi:hypothetical protein
MRSLRRRPQSAAAGRATRRVINYSVNHIPDGAPDNAGD